MLSDVREAFDRKFVILFANFFTLRSRAILRVADVAIVKERLPSNKLLSTTTKRTIERRIRARDPRQEVASKKTPNVADASRDRRRFEIPHVSSTAPPSYPSAMPSPERSPPPTSVSLANVRYRDERSFRISSWR